MGIPRSVQPFTLEKMRGRGGTYLATKSDTNGNVVEDTAKTRAYCYDRQPSRGTCFYVSINVNKFFKQSGTHLLIEIAINCQFSIYISAKDVTPEDEEAVSPMVDVVATTTDNVSPSTSATTPAPQDVEFLRRN